MERAGDSVGEINGRAIMHNYQVVDSVGQRNGEGVDLPPPSSELRSSMTNT